MWPGLESMSDPRRLVGSGDVISFVYSVPLAVLGIVWLVLSTNLNLIRDDFLFLVFNLALVFLFNRLSYFMITEIRTDRYGSSEESLAPMIQWSAVLLLGQTALWLSVIYLVFDLVNKWRFASSLAKRWGLLRNFSLSMAIYTLGFLLSLSFYGFLGGEIPLSGLSTSSVIHSLSAIISHLLFTILILSGYLIYHLGVQRILAEKQSIQPFLRFIMLSIGLPYVAYPFGILLAGLYTTNGIEIYTFLLIGLLFIAYLTRQLSWAAESSRQQSKQLEQLEQLGRDLLDVIPDSSMMPQVLEQHVPVMFPSGHSAIWIFPDQVLLCQPQDWQIPQQETWNFIMEQIGPNYFLSKDRLPWEPENNNHLAIVTTPIRKSKSSPAIGGILLELRALAKSWDKKSLTNLFPAIQSLADQIGSTLHQSDVYERSLEFQNITQELRLAGRIQASFLPNKFPTIPGWQLAVTLLPARETSGDFFDVIELSDNRLGIIVADVADKGVGSALYMALSRTLIRTYAEEYDADPEIVFFAANNRLLKDARANLFITAFYGIIDPKQGTLTYCNAGHIPPYLIRASDEESVDFLSPTGIAMGIEKNATWTTEVVTINEGDILVLFTDGIPDAQDELGNFFNEEIITEIVRTNNQRLAFEIQSSIIEEVQKFSGNNPQSDDITLMVLVRDK